MFDSDEKIDASYLIDDVNDLIQLHLDVIDGYEQAIGHSKESEFTTQLEEWVQRHRTDIDRLAQLSRQLGGEPRTKPDLGAIATTLRVAFARVFSDAGLAEALYDNEARLELEYTRAINSLAALPGMEPVFKQNRLDTQERMRQLRQQSSEV